MALILRRLSWAALALAAVALPALRLGSKAAVTPIEQLRHRLGDLRNRRDNASFLWGALAERDSGGALGTAQAQSTTPPILLRGFGGDERSHQADSMVGMLWKAIGAADSSVRIAVVIYNASQYNLPLQQWWHYSGALMKQTDRDMTCVALISGARVPNGTIEVSKYSAPDALGPCAMLAAFGPPGSAIRPYLEATRYASARSTAWLTRPASFIDGQGEPPWPRGSPWSETGPEPAPSLLLSNPLIRSLADLLAPPYELGSSGLRCLSGMKAECRNAVLDTSWIARRTELAPSDLTFASGFYHSLPGRGVLAPRPTASYWFSDLIRDQGREKFARFWKSNGSFESAFQAAFGQSLGTWTMAWGTRQWENSEDSWWEKYRGQPRLLGANLAASGPLVVLGWSALALVIAGWAARTREVSDA